MLRLATRTVLIAGWLGLFGLLVGSLVGCGGGDGGGPSDTAASLTEQGWVLYEQGSGEEAVVKFYQATRLDPSYKDAYNGLGWSYGRMDSLTKAVTNFDLCISRGDTRPDPYAGKAPACRDLDPPQFASAITAASTALSKDADFVFEHLDNFDYRDLHLIKAQCYFALNQYANAHLEVDILEPGNTLDPEAESFISDLAAAIEDLEAEFGG